MAEARSRDWSLKHIEFTTPDPANGQIDVFRSQEVDIIETQEGVGILHATDSLDYKMDGEQYLLASIAFSSTPPECISDIEEETDEMLKESARIVWRMASHIYSFLTHISLGSPAVLSPYMVSDEKRHKPVFSLGRNLEEE